MRFISTPIPDLFIVELIPFSDERGSFTRLYCMEEFRSIGLVRPFTQINISKNIHGGTIRGLHFQFPPVAEDKLIRCSRGRIFDVVVDLRHQSPTFFQWFGLELSHESDRQLFVPRGFAHGFQTLCDHCEVVYHHTEYYQPNLQGGVRYDDPKLDIAWPLPVSCISQKDLELPVWTPSMRGLES
ncbi:MAG: dTDP-4-dehydrorhamnose 3,5-epimerase [Candidatus Delongbacteria bacterium]|nr:dTDP-4-dehydrorhamnose 3,5-epimerase [Candidatus Delongbacteria bacterium]